MIAEVTQQYGTHFQQCLVEAAPPQAAFRFGLSKGDFQNPRPLPIPCKAPAVHPCSILRPPMDPTTLAALDVSLCGHLERPRASEAPRSPRETRH